MSSLAIALLALVPSAAETHTRLFVAAESADEVWELAFDGERLEVANVVPVGYQATEIEGPHGLALAPDGQHWFVSMAHGKPFGLLYKYATGTNQLVAEVELGLFPATLAISPDTGLLYCVNFDLHGDMRPSSVSIVDPEAMVEVARTLTGPMPHGSRLSPDGARHYSCAMMSDELIELDAASFEVLRRLVLDDGTGGVAQHRLDGVSRRTEDSRLGRSRSGSLDGVSRRTEGRSSSGTHASSKPTWVQPHPEERLAYVALNGAHQVVEVDLETWKVRRRFPTARGPYNLELTPCGERLVVTHKGAQSIGVWDLGEGRELARLPTARRVTHGVVIGRDGRYAFVSSEGVGAERGVVDVFDLEALRHVATVEVGLQAGGIALWEIRGEG